MPLDSVCRASWQYPRIGGDLAHILLLAFVAALYPTLLAAVTTMLLLPSPKRLMLGYLVGAYTTSITLGLVIVFALGDPSFGPDHPTDGGPAPLGFELRASDVVAA